MTIIAAQRFGDRIITLADTMILDPGATKSNIIPGQLKAIVLSLNVSLAYAGRVVVGIDAARACKQILERGGGLDQVIAELEDKSRAGDCDFIVSSHERGPQVFKVSNGRASESQSSHWAGNASALQRYREVEQMLRQGRENVATQSPGIAMEIAPEYEFSGAFSNLFLGSPQVCEDVGGFVVNQLSSPFGHCYQGHAGAYSPGPIVIGGPPAGPSSGSETYGYNSIAPAYRGVAIMGAYVEYASVGYVYDPLRADETEVLRGVNLTEIHSIIDQRAKEAGGKPEAEC